MLSFTTSPSHPEPTFDIMGFVVETRKDIVVNKTENPLASNALGMQCCQGLSTSQLVHLDIYPSCSSSYYPSQPSVSPSPSTAVGPWTNSND